MVRYQRWLDIHFREISIVLHFRVHWLHLQHWANTAFLLKMKCKLIGYQQPMTDFLKQKPRSSPLR